jgi:hypothetical protein
MSNLVSALGLVSSSSPFSYDSIVYREFPFVMLFDAVYIFVPRSTSLLAEVLLRYPPPAPSPRLALEHQPVPTLPGRPYMTATPRRTVFRILPVGQSALVGYVFVTLAMSW